MNKKTMVSVLLLTLSANLFATLNFSDWKTQTDGFEDTHITDFAYSRDRKHNTLFVGVGRNGVYTSKDGHGWTLSVDPQVILNGVKYVDGDGFYVYANAYDWGTMNDVALVWKTEDGVNLYPVFEQENFLISDIESSGYELLIIGRSDHCHVYRTSLPIRVHNIDLESFVAPLWDEFESGIDTEDFSAFQNVNPSLSIETGQLGTGVLINTESSVYELRGSLWEKVFQADDHSFISTLFFYRGKYHIGTTNHLTGHRVIVLSPPEGVEVKDAMYVSENALEWDEHLLDFQPLIYNPSVDGPFLLAYENTYLQSIDVFTADEGIDDLGKVSGPAFVENAHIVWAKGKYHMLTDKGWISSPFMGFENSLYKSIPVSTRTDGVSYITVNGWFGMLDPVDYPVLKHFTLGEIEFSIDDEDVIHVFSEELGVLRTSRADVPYFTSLADDHIYFVNFYDTYHLLHLEGSGDIQRFYDHSLNIWTDDMECQSYGYGEWYGVALKYVLQTQELAAKTVSAVNEQLLLNAVAAKEDLELAHKVAMHFITMGEALEGTAENPQHNGVSVSVQSYVDLRNAAENAYSWAVSYYNASL